METVEKSIFAEIAKRRKIKIATLGLRFDRVVIRLINDLHEFADRALPNGTTVLVTMTAPIRLPAKTAAELCSRINPMVVGVTSARDKHATINGNNARIRVLRHSNKRAPKLLGAVHNQTSDPRVIFNLLEEWLDE